MDYRKKKHAVYLCTYHIVIVTKYRKPVITDAMGDGLKNYAECLVQDAGGDMVSAETDRDHMHMLVSLPPDMAPTQMVRIIKTQLSKYAKEYFRDEVAKCYYGDTAFWTPSYFITTTGTVSLEKVKAYVNSQRTEEHHRKYIKRK